MSVSLRKFGIELRSVGLPGNCSSSGRVDFADGTCWHPGQEPKNDQERTAAEVYAAHDHYDYAAERAKEYPSTAALVVALWERDVEGRPELADALQVQREAVKAKWPKK